MITIEVAEVSFLGTERMSVGDVERFCINFDFILEPGVLLTGAIASTSSSLTDVENPPDIANDMRAIYLLVSAGPAGETFTVALRVTTNDGQTLHYTIVFVVDGPLVMTAPGPTGPLIFGPTGPTGPQGVGSGT